MTKLNNEWEERCTACGRLDCQFAQQGWKARFNSRLDPVVLHKRKDSTGWLIAFTDQDDVKAFIQFELDNAYKRGREEGRAGREQNIMKTGEEASNVYRATVKSL